MNWPETQNCYICKIITKFNPCMIHDEFGKWTIRCATLCDECLKKENLRVKGFYEKVNDNRKRRT